MVGTLGEGKDFCRPDPARTWPNQQIIALLKFTFVRTNTVSCLQMRCRIVVGIFSKYSIRAQGKSEHCLSIAVEYHRLKFEIIDSVVIEVNEHCRMPECSVCMGVNDFGLGGLRQCQRPNAGGACGERIHAK